MSMTMSRGGRPVLIASALLLAAGQSVLAIAPNLSVFLVGSVVIGARWGLGYVIRLSLPWAACMATAPGSSLRH